MNLERYNKILVIDDSTAILQLLLSLLNEQGYSVYPASDGELALEFVQSTLPDLILLDIKMPGMDGYEVCGRLKADTRTASIPVIFLSVLEDERDKVKGFQAGGVDYITKPFQPEEMLARVRIHLRIRELTEGLEQEVSARTKDLMVVNKRLEEEIAVRRQAEEELRDSRQRLDNIVANSPGAIYRCANDPDWTMEFISAGITRISGYAAEDFLGNRVRSYASIIHPDDRQSVADAVTSGLARKNRYEKDYRLVAADGSPRWVHEQGRGVFAPEGQLLYLDGTIFDITVLRMAEETLKLNAERMEALLQLNQMTSATRDEIFNFTFEAAVGLTRSKLGYLALMNEDETVMTMQLWSQEAMAECKVSGTPRIYPVETNGLWGEAVRQRRPIITNDYSAPNPWKNGTPDGHIKLIRHMNVPVIVSGKIVLVAGVGNKDEDYNEGDVQQLSLLMEGMWRLIECMRNDEELRRYHCELEETVQRRTEELRLARDAAEAANRAKSAFLSNMSHELRTPLNAILGFSNMLRRDQQLTENQRENLDIINRSGKHLLALINDVLELAKVEAGRLQVEADPFDICIMVSEVVDMLQLRAAEKGLQLLIDQSVAFPCHIKGDEARLRQALVNLVNNAIKFTEQGCVTIRLSVEPEDNRHIRIEVDDTGPGISADDQQRLFKPFVQLAPGTKQEGTGLGLVITRQLVELMGGTINLQSTLGTGSLFRIDLPVEMAGEGDNLSQQAEKMEAAYVTGLAPGQPSFRILIVEDELENQLLLTQLMERIGLTVKVAENGKEGVQLFQNWRPHLIWMDRRMPVMDGIEATKAIRNLPGGKEVKIVAVTASVFIEQRDEFMTAGMDDLVLKPYDSNEIYECLSNHLGVQYIYADAQPIEPVDTLQLTAERLSVLPQELRGELIAALESLEQEHIRTVIERVPPYDLVLYKTLSQSAENFDYPAILNALRTNVSANEA